MLELAVAAPGGNVMPPVLLEKANDVTNLHTIKTIFRQRYRPVILHLIGNSSSMTEFEGNR